eukprot:NODE_583_length_6431_cov_0.491788.p6 type:complete len:138 gc:universal NODE_583_length_6431_cov_0.491788:6108-5695(-)
MTWSKQAKSLIFRNLQFGTFRSKMGNTFKRKWNPNVHTQKLFSQTLDMELGNKLLENTERRKQSAKSERMKREGVKTSSWALRTIDQCGGIDAFLLTTPKKKLQQSEVAMKFRSEIISKLKSKTDNVLHLEYLKKIE